MEMTGDRRQDSCIDAVGTEVDGTGLSAKSDRVKEKLHLEDDRPAVLREAIKCCRKGGTLSVPGVYIGRVDNLPFGSVMNKALTIKTGQTHVQRYLDPLLERVEDGDIDYPFVVTHDESLDKGPELSETFNHKHDDCSKVGLEP